MITRPKLKKAAPFHYINKKFTLHKHNFFTLFQHKASDVCLISNLFNGGHLESVSKVHRFSFQTPTNSIQNSSLCINTPCAKRHEREPRMHQWRLLKWTFQKMQRSTHFLELQLITIWLCCDLYEPLTHIKSVSKVHHCCFQCRPCVYGGTESYAKSILDFQSKCSGFELYSSESLQ